MSIRTLNPPKAYAGGASVRAGVQERTTVPSHFRALQKQVCAAERCRSWRLSAGTEGPGGFVGARQEPVDAVVVGRVWQVSRLRERLEPFDHAVKLE